jgi:hypothetical protein
MELPDPIAGAIGVASRSGVGRVSRAEIKAMRGVKIIFGVAIINLMFLAFELAMNVIRTFTG